MFVIWFLHCFIVCKALGRKKFHPTYLQEANYPFLASVSAAPFQHAQTVSSLLQEAYPEGLYSALFLFSFYLEAKKKNPEH